jgi:hypothetical protein
MRRLAFLAMLAVAASCGVGGDGGTPDAADEVVPEVEDDAEPDPVVETEDPGTTTDPAQETAPAECNPILQASGKSGCDGDQNCIYLDASTTKCVSKGPVPVGSLCGGVDKQCEVGACLNLAGVGFRCYQYCKGKTWCEKGQDCIPVAGVPPAAGVCTLPPSAYEDARCDLLKQDCAAADQGCYLTSIVSFGICLAAGTASQGEPCSGQTDCKEGFACNGNACAQLCGTGSSDPKCPDPYSCKQPYGLGAYLCLE